MSGTAPASAASSSEPALGIERVDLGDAGLGTLALPDPSDPLQAPLASADLRARRVALDTLEDALPGLPLSQFTQTTDAASLSVGRSSDRLLSALSSDDFLERLFQQFSLHGGTNLKLVREQEHRSLDDVIVIDPTAGLEDRGRVRAAAVAAALDDGFTVVLDGIELREPNAVVLAGLFERAFGCTINTNGYLSARHHTSFGAHWDDQEVVILQLIGRKDWTVEEPAALSMNKESHGETVSGRTAWQGRVGVGDSLYVPRGWGHIVNGIDELTYHHTITIPRINGLHVIEGILSDPRAREDRARYGPVPMVPGRDPIEPLPLDAAATDRAVRRAVARARFHMSRRSTTSLRATAEALLSPSLEGALVRCPAPGGWTVAVPDEQGPEIDAPPGSLIVGQAGQFLALPHRLIPAIADLTDGRTHDGASVEVDLVKALLRLGVLEIVVDPGAWGITFA